MNDAFHLREFTAEEWDRLPFRERIEHCRFMSREARMLGDGAPLAFKSLYLDISAEWSELAKEMESHTRCAA